jgi:galactitol-specific phosphotransferase system IIC component
MYAFVVFVGLALALAVVGEVLGEVLPIKFPKALTTTITVGIAILGAWAIDYSVFRAFGQDLRASWENPVVTGIVLVGAGEFLRAVAGNMGLSISIGSRDRSKAA